MAIESIISEIARLGSSLELWRTIRLIVVVGTVFLASATLVAQWMELRLSRELAERQGELLKIKDEQLRSELADKDVKIADANRAAGEANVEAARAGRAAADANERAGNAIERAARFEREAEELRRRNIEMQESLTPRSLVWGYAAQARLSRFAGTTWDLLVPAGDLEAGDFGNLIGMTLKKCGWPFGSGSTVHGERFTEGVVIAVASSSPHRAAAAELVSYITANRAHARLIENDSLPADRILIRVGSKPRSPILMPVLKDEDKRPLRETDEQNKQQMERARRDWRLPPYDK